MSFAARARGLSGELSATDAAIRPGERRGLPEEGAPAPVVEIDEGYIPTEAELADWFESLPEDEPAVELDPEDEGEFDKWFKSLPLDPSAKAVQA